MSIVTLATSTLPSHPSVLADSPADFDRRWAAWTARGLAHERSVRRRFLRVAIVVVTIAVAAVAVYALLSS